MKFIIRENSRHFLSLNILFFLSENEKKNYEHFALIFTTRQNIHKSFPQRKFIFSLFTHHFSFTPPLRLSSPLLRPLSQLTTRYAPCLTVPFSPSPSPFPQPPGSNSPPPVPHLPSPYPSKYKTPRFAPLTAPQKPQAPETRPSAYSTVYTWSARPSAARCQRPSAECALRHGRGWGRCRGGGFAP